MQCIRTFRQAAALIGLCVLAGVPAASRAADQYKVDTVHSTVIFRVKHINIGYAYGRFNDITGTVALDEENPANDVFDIQVKADSIDTGNGKRDQHLKSPDFLNVKEFPAISFKSKEVKLVKANSFEVTGDLTFHGVTKTVKVQLNRTGTGPYPWGGQGTGFETNFSIRRSDYGMAGMPGALGEDIWLIVSFEAAKQ